MNRLGIQQPPATNASANSRPCPTSIHRKNIALYGSPLQERRYEHGIEVPIVPWPAVPDRLVRISGALYNEVEQYVELAQALEEIL